MTKVVYEYEEHPIHKKVYTTLWACPRQLTRGWGCPTILKRMNDFLGEKPDVYFGLTDGITDTNAITVDIDPENNPTVVADWNNLPFPDRHFKFSFWDPPYDKRYDPGLREIARVTDQRLAILHQIIYPQSPILSSWEKYALIGIIPTEKDSQLFVELLLSFGYLMWTDEILEDWIESFKAAVTTGPNMRIRCLQIYDRITTLEDFMEI